MNPVLTAARDHIRGVIRADLLARPELAHPSRRGAIDGLVCIAAGLALIDKLIHETGCGPEDVMPHHELTELLKTRLVEIGTHLISGTIAEETLCDALITRNATLALMPVAGNA